MIPVASKHQHQQQRPQQPPPPPVNNPPPQQNDKQQQGKHGSRASAATHHAAAAAANTARTMTTTTRGGGRGGSGRLEDWPPPASPADPGPQTDEYPSETRMRRDDGTTSDVNIDHPHTTSARNQPTTTTNRQPKSTAKYRHHVDTREEKRTEPKEYEMYRYSTRKKE